MEKIVNCKVKESRVLYSDSVRRLCIDNNWYTCGTSSDYKKLLDYVASKRNFTINDIKKIAINIYNHSDIDTLASEYGCENELYLNHIIWEILNNITYSFVTTNNIVNEF